MATELQKLQGFLDTKEVDVKVEKDPRLRSLRRVEDIMKLITEGVTREEFLKSFKAVVAIVLKAEKRNIQAVEKLQKTFEEETKRFIEANSGFLIQKKKIESIEGLEKDFDVATEALNKSSDQLKESTIEMSEELKKEFSSTMEQIKETNADDLSEIKKEIDTSLLKALDIQNNSMNFLRDKVRSTKDGHTPTKQELVALIEPLIPELPETPEIPEVEMPDLERFDEEDERLSGKIEVLEDKIEEVSKQKRLGGTGGDANVAFSMSRLGTSETPGGLINSSNKVYTLTRTPKFIFSFYINGMFLHPSEYTIVGSTITFSVALPASLSGTSFTIIFV